MAAFIANAAAILGTVLLTEGIFAFLEEREGDPEGDVTKLLENIQIKNQLAARTSLAAQQTGQERIDEQFAGFNQIGSQALSSAALADSPRAIGEQLRRGQEVRATDTQLVDLVSSKLGMSPQDFAKATHPGRMGDLTGMMRKVQNVGGQETQ